MLGVIALDFSLKRKFNQTVNKLGIGQTAGLP
jgi:hypothetical protein